MPSTSAAAVAAMLPAAVARISVVAAAFTRPRARTSPVVSMAVRTAGARIMPVPALHPAAPGAPTTAATRAGRTTPATWARLTGTAVTTGAGAIGTAATGRTCGTGRAGPGSTRRCRSVTPPSGGAACRTTTTTTSITRGTRTTTA